MSATHTRFSISQLTACAGLLLFSSFTGACQPVEEEAHELSPDSPTTSLQVIGSQSPQPTGTPSSATTTTPEAGAAPVNAARPAPSLAPPEPTPALSVPPTASAPAHQAPISSLSVGRLTLASGILEREPILPSKIFVGDPLYAFFEAVNPTDSAEQLIVTFEHESGETVGFIPLTVPEQRKRYRTWGLTRNLHLIGEWSAVVRDSQGKELAREKFTVLEYAGC